MRRTGIMAGLAAAVLLAAPSVGALAAEPDVKIRLHGTVFADANGNGKQDPGEKGLAGVRVSDFWTTVLTDANGAYDFDGTVKRSIDPPEIPNVYVAVPPGYTVYRVADYFRRIEYEGKTEFRADFGLKPDARTLEKEFCFVTAGDASTYEGLLRYVTPIVNAMDRKPAFVVSTGDTFLGRYGDVTYDEDMVDKARQQYGIKVWDVLLKQDPERLVRMRSSIATLHAALNARVVNCKGNHENHCFEEVLGPPCYSFHWGGVCFIVRGTWLETSKDADFECKTFWQTPEAQEDWFRREIALIAKGTPCVVVAHYKSGVTAEMWKAVADRGLVPAGQLWAHSHRSCVEWLDASGVGKVHAIDVGGTPGQMPRNKEFVPQGFFVATMKDGKMGETYEPDGTADFMRIASPASGEEVAPNGMDVMVNAGGTSTTARSARCRVDGGAWTEMKQTGRYSWSAEGVKPGGAGRHEVQVEATTLGGKTLAASVSVVSKDGAKAAVKFGEDWTGLGGNLANTGDVGATGKPPLRLAWSRNVGSPVMMGCLIAAKGKVHALLARYSLDARSGIVSLDAASGRETGFCDFSGIKFNLLTTYWLQYDAGTFHAAYPFTSTGWSEGYRKMVSVKEGSEERPLAWDTESGRVWGMKMHGDLMLGKVETSERIDGKHVSYLHLGAWEMKARKAAWKSERLYTGSDEWVWEIVSNGFEVPAVDATAERVYLPVGCASLKDGKTIWRALRNRHRNPWVWAPTVVVRNGKLFAHGEAWDANTGASAWSEARPRIDERGRVIANSAMTSFTVVGGGTVVFAWEDGLVKGVNEADGKVKWEAKTGLPFMGGLAVMGPAVYGVSRSGVVLGLDIETGKEAWRCDLGTPIYAAPVATGNTLFVADWGGTVYAFAGR